MCTAILMSRVSGMLRKLKIVIPFLKHFFIKCLVVKRLFVGMILHIRKYIWTHCMLMSFICLFFTL